ncbi:RHS repeat-associated core domain-containing protein, partial [Streptococcus suis]
ELTGVRQGDGSLITYTYDDYGNITKMVYPDGSEVAYSYDELDRLTKVTDRDGKVTTYAYDKAGDMTKIERGDGTTSALTYDAAHRVTEIVHRDKKGKLISSYAYEYDDGNYIDKETITQDGETLVQTYTYDSLGQIVQMTVSSKDGKELSQFSYTYDHAGNKLTSTETVDGKESKTEFSYDAENRLLEMKSGDKTITYTYDKNGNRTSSGAGDAKLDYIYDTENRLLAVKDKEGLLFAALYDGDDNRVFTASRTQATNTYQLFKRKPADKKRKSPYTAPDGEANSLFWYGFTQNVVQFFSSFTTSEGYDWIETFDTVSTAYHQKVAKDRATEEGLVVNPPSEDNLPGEDEVLYRSQVQDVLIPYTTKEDTYNYYETRNYVNDVNQQHTQVLQTYDDQLQKRETYVYGNGRATYTNESTGDSYHYLTSQSGSVTGLTQNGNSVASSSYNLYGATKQTTDTTGNPFAYNGEARDVTGLDYLRARYYDSQAGIFLTADTYPGSQTDPLSQNLYAYVQNNPANYTDSSGHIRSPHVMLDDRFGGKVYDSPRPLINTDDGTLYAPSTPEHKAHQIRQQQTGNYSYVYTPKVYSNTPIIKPTSYAQAQAQRDRAREQALAEQRRQQNIRNEYSRATGSKGKAKLREAQNLFKNWGKALEETLKHVCNPQTTKGKDSGSRNKPNISVADFRKIEEANKYGLTVAEKAKIDDMNLAQLTNTYSFLNNVTPYQGYSVSNAKERDYIIARYRKLMSESQPKPPSIKDNPLYNYYNQIILTGVDPHTGRKVSNIELTQAIAGQSALIAGPFVDAASLGYGYSYREQVGNNGISSIKTSTTGTGKVYGPQPADGPLQPLKPYGPEQYSGPLQPLETPKVKVDFYVAPDGNILPATGYRYMNSEYAEETIRNMEAPGGYIGFSRFDSAKQVREAYQISSDWSDAKLRGEFDTLQVFDGVRVPRAYGDKVGEVPEPLTKVYPEFGIGGYPQLITDRTKNIKFKDVTIIGD